MKIRNIRYVVIVLIVTWISVMFYNLNISDVQSVRDTYLVLTVLPLNFLLTIVYSGVARRGFFLERHTLFRLRGQYSNSGGTYLMVDFGNNKIITVFIKELHQKLTIGHYYVWDGMNILSRHDT